MPISVRDFTWDQTDGEVHVTVPLKGVKPAKADVFATDHYVKINYPPYLFEVDLFDSIDEPQSVASFADGCVKFRLVKRVAHTWSQLHAEGEKDAVLKRRNASIDAHTQRLQDIERARLEEKARTERAMVEQQIEVERRERERVERLKRDEAEAAARDVMRWQAAVSGRAAPVFGDEDDNDATDSDDEPSAPAIDAKGKGKSAERNAATLDTSAVSVPPVRSAAGASGAQAHAEVDKGTSRAEAKSIFDADGDEDDGVRLGRSSDEARAANGGSAPQSTASKPAQAPKSVPAPRSAGTITVSFTPRTFPTAARESRLPEEEEWLNQQKARQARVHDAGDAGPSSNGAVFEERSVQWLKDKGTAFARGGNFASAVEAYTEAMRLDDGIPVLFADRAACHLRMGNAAACVDDCTSALALLPETMPSNVPVRAALLSCRAAAHESLGNAQTALEDAEAASKLDKGNEDFARRVEQLRAAVGALRT